MGNLGISIVNDDSGLDQANSDYNQTVIKVVGCGGGGSNAVNRMISRKLSNVDFIVLNTDLQALNRSNADTKIPIGQKVTKGLGAGGKPEVGEMAAEEDKEQITNILRGADMVFITAGMGGGTGTGSAPIVAQIAKDLGCLTVAVVTTPFQFEGNVRMRNAKEGLEKLREKVDSLIVIPNQLLFSNIDRTTTVTESFKMADEILCQGVEGISNIITKPGDVNTDFADVRNAMSGQGNAIFGIGVGEGENRAADAAYAAINNPMLEDSRIDGAKNILVNICASSEVSLVEVGEICNIVTASADKDYNMFWGQVTQPELEGKITVTVIATGFDKGSKVEEEEVVQPVVTQPKVDVSRDDVVDMSELNSIFSRDKSANSSVSAGGSFVSKKDLFTDSKEEETESGNGLTSSWGESLFDTKSKPVKHDFNKNRDDSKWSDPNDLSKPAIWSKTQFDRGINLE
ncbi:MAG: cell division protein FtsZ [Treponema sp.]|nr:cell division protein FtsZ [Treponema sp.]MDY4985562.1 cell division protein FtsZ [Treponema sp.]